MLFKLTSCGGGCYGGFVNGGDGCNGGVCGGVDSFGSGHVGQAATVRKHFLQYDKHTPGLAYLFKTST